GRTRLDVSRGEHCRPRVPRCCVKRSTADRHFKLRQRRSGMTNREVVSAFLGAYQRHDYRAMHACLAPGVEFCDLAFKKIAGDQVRAMWQWYCVRTPTGAEPIAVPGFETMSSNGETVNAEYWVRYMPAADKHVNYVIRSEFTV